MIIDLAQFIGPRAGRAAIAAAVERAAAAGSLEPGDRLPTVRELASTLGVSPATVAAAYRELRRRGVVTAAGRRGTTVAGALPAPPRPRQALPAGVRDLARGNPDPALLPRLPRLERAHTLYGVPAKLDTLVEWARSQLGDEGELAVVGGALDGIERALRARLRPGDGVVVEDPVWPRIADLVRALALVPVPVAVDDRGLVPEELADALPRAAAVIATPRGQNPTGAAVDEQRGAALRRLLAGHRDVLVVEDDYAFAVAGAPYVPVHGTTDAWIVVRSLSKAVGPDLRIAVAAGDELTIARLERQQLLGAGWVSHLLQRLAADVLRRPATVRLLARAERRYAERRHALVAALAAHGIEAHGSSGLGVWIPVAEEAATAQALLERGWAVSPGERYRQRAAPGLRVTTTTLEPAEAKRLAADVAAALAPDGATYAG